MADHCDKNSHHSLPKPKWWHRIDWSQVVLDGVLIIIGIKLAGIYSGQLNQMIESNGINRQALVAVQRAFLTCQDVAPRRIAQMDGNTRRETWLFTTPCENSGTTPANITAQTFWVDIAGAGPSEEQFHGMPPLARVSVVGPKSFHNVGNMSIREEQIFGRVLAEDITKERPTANDHALPLVFWGWITYRDIFPDTKLHLTEFCKQSAMIEVHPSTPQAPYEWGWSECDHHNCADEYCPDYEAIVKLSKP